MFPNITARAAREDGLHSLTVAQTIPTMSSEREVYSSFAAVFLSLQRYYQFRHVKDVCHYLPDWTLFTAVGFSKSEY